MNRFMCVLLAVAVICCVVFPAHAAIEIPVTMHFTADNVTSAFYKDGAAPVAIGGISGNLSSWQETKSVTFNLESGHSYQLIFRVNNDVTKYATGSTNPAGFIAEIVGDVGGAKLSSADWKWAVDDKSANQDPTGSDFQGFISAAFNWSNATTYGVNGVGPWNTRPNISNQAAWIWSDHNGAALANPNFAENYLWIRVDLFTAPDPASIATPEPASIAIWSLLGLGCFFGRRIVRRRKAGGSRGWSNENRAAIQQIFDRTRA